MRFRFTQQFESTLQQALDFLLDGDAPEAASQLADIVLEHLPALLREHPRIGRDFMLHRPATAQARALHEQVRVRLGAAGEVREYILGDYLVLYAIEGDTVYAISIRHHRQSGFVL
ncbi:type II toxin-antitoxin system RelE/ParE family toxin [Luteimonas sp. R10]|uniref:type II toxin-antitoxin system RelE/ParE family toxin n=1 Tax=Luteimonas sp. R10 TaxID=3108176 RepID=UPI0030869851|nr:type II toxin-antitoxin system RelE/ParE family toxin [Luteimonas sp. R10]